MLGEKGGDVKRQFFSLKVELWTLSFFYADYKNLHPNCGHNDMQWFACFDSFIDVYKKKKSIFFIGFFFCKYMKEGFSSSNFFTIFLK